MYWLRQYYTSRKVWVCSGMQIIGASVSKAHTSVVYGNMCINQTTDWPTDRLTDQPCLSHSHDTDTLHTCPHCYALSRSRAWWWTVQCIVVIATRLRMPMMEKRKAETPSEWTAKLEWERETSEPLHTCASLLVLSSLAFMYGSFSCHAVTSHKPFFTLSYTCALHSGQDFHACNAWACIDLPSRLACCAVPCHNAAQAHPHQRWPSV